MKFRQTYAPANPATSVNVEYSAAIKDAVVWNVKSDGNLVEHEIFRLYKAESIEMVQIMGGVT